MNKITLIANEKVVHRVRFSGRILLIDILFLIGIMSLAAQTGRTTVGSPIGFILLLAYIPLLVKTFFDFYRIFLHRVYITNFRLIYIKGYLIKRVKTYNLDMIIGVYFKSNFFDRAKNMTSFKITINDDRQFILKNVKNGNFIVDLLSNQLIKQNQAIERKYKKSKKNK